MCSYGNRMTAPIEQRRADQSQRGAHPSGWRRSMDAWTRWGTHGAPVRPAMDADHRESKFANKGTGTPPCPPYMLGCNTKIRQANFDSMEKKKFNSNVHLPQITTYLPFVFFFFFFWQFFIVFSCVSHYPCHLM